MTWVLIIIGVVLVVLILWAISLYNSFVQLRNNLQKSWGNINVLLKQRSAELPKLIASVKGYMKHERQTLTVLTRARTAMMRATTRSKKAAADNLLSGALKTLFAVAENYPKLRANENFKHLQERISGIESSLADRREFYNDSANIYNIRLESFPDMLIAKMMGLEQQPMFRVSENDKKDVTVKF